MNLKVLKIKPKHTLLNKRKVQTNFFEKPIQNHELFNGSSLNVIWALVAGERHKFGYVRLAEFIRFVEK